MENKEYNGKRRKLLKSIAAGSGVVFAGKLLPESWTKPVVNSIMLPAHAQTSTTTTLPPTTTLIYSCSVTRTEGGNDAISVTHMGQTDGTVNYTITNTGEGPITGGMAGFNIIHGDTGGINGVSADITSDPVPDPFNKGTSFEYKLSAGISITDGCNEPQSGSITVAFNSNETSCELETAVTCQPPPG